MQRVEYIKINFSSIELIEKHWMKYIWFLSDLIINFGDVVWGNCNKETLYCLKKRYKQRQPE